MSLKPICGSTHVWSEKQPRALSGAYSHSRIVYIGTPQDQEGTPWILKIATSGIRRNRKELDLPHAEEVAYKVCKLFKWDAVPKTKVLHASETNEKIKKYELLTAPFKSAENAKTFTLHVYVKGAPLSSFADKCSLDLDLASYQKVYLLGMILGNFDSRDDNILYNSETGKLFAVDNEYLGKQHYDPRGVLNRFDHLKQKEIDGSILDVICAVTHEKFNEIGEKYKERGACLLQLWDNEPISFPQCFKRSANEPISKKNPLRDNREESLEPDDSPLPLYNCWGTILKNFVLLRSEIRALREEEKMITLASLENKIAAFNRRTAVEDLDLEFSDLFD